MICKPELIGLAMSFGKNIFSLTVFPCICYHDASSVFVEILSVF